MLRRRAPAHESIQNRGVVGFALGGRRFAVPAGQIAEIARLTSYTPLPCEDPANLGLVLHRDRLIPLVDLGPRLGVQRAAPMSSSTLCLFVETDLGEIGFPLDEVLGFEAAPGSGFTEDTVLLDLNRCEGVYGKSASR